LGVLGESRQPIFAQALALMLGETEIRLMEARLLRQLLQASLLAREQGVPAELPPHLEQAAAKCWRSTSNAVPSLSHLRVAGLLKTLGVKHSLMAGVGLGLPVIDIAIEPEAGRPPVAVQVWPAPSSSQ
jgi:hypothetical protein